MRRTLFLALLLMVFFSCKKGKKYHDESKVEIENVSNGTLKDILEFHFVESLQNQ